MQSRILAVLDEESYSSEFKKSLEPMHDVTICRDISKGKQRISDTARSFDRKHKDRDQPFDLIVCAVHLNDEDNGNAIDFLRWTRKNAELDGVPFLLLCTKKGLLIKEFMIGLQAASCALGAAGILTANNITSADFRMAIEQHLHALTTTHAQAT